MSTTLLYVGTLHTAATLAPRTMTSPPYPWQPRVMLSSAYNTACSEGYPRPCRNPPSTEQTCLRGMCTVVHDLARDCTAHLLSIYTRTLFVVLTALKHPASTDGSKRSPLFELTPPLAPACPRPRPPAQLHCMVSGRPRERVISPVNKVCSASGTRPER